MVELDALMAEVAAEMRVILSEYVRINRAKRHFGASEASLPDHTEFFRTACERVASYEFRNKARKVWKHTAECYEVRPA